MNVFPLFLLAVFCSVYCKLSEEQINKKWESFKAKYGRKYGTHKVKKFRGVSEAMYRKGIFRQKVQEIHEHNKKYKQGVVTFEMGINKFSDMTAEEMKPYTHGLIEPLKLPKPDVTPPSNKSPFLKKYQVVYTQLNWAVPTLSSPIKNQKACGSCWACAALGALEILVRIEMTDAQRKKNKITSFSVQQLVDCDKGNLGCKGGWSTKAFDYIKKNGIATESRYQYTGKKGSCRAKAAGSAPVSKGFGEANTGDEILLKKVLCERGPVVTYISVPSTFGSYKSGVFHYHEYDKMVYRFCSNVTTHAVVIVGYGKEKGKDYWLVKNSWGSDWGDKGYIKMARNHNNECGIGLDAIYPIV